MGSLGSPTSISPWWARHRSLLAALALLAFFAQSPAQAGCSEPRLSNTDGLVIRAPEVLLVTHPSKAFDPRLSSKRGIDEAVRFAKARGMPVLYLKDESPARDYFVDDCEPSHWLPSQDGELPIIIDATHLYVAGGHLELCLSRSLHDVLEQWVRLPDRSRKMTFFMDAIYSNGKLFDEESPYYADLQRFLSVTNYRRPGGEAWPKLSLLETMGILVKPEAQQRYLEEALPKWDRSLPRHWRVDMVTDDGQTQLLRAAAGKGPTMTFVFEDSALEQ